MPTDRQIEYIINTTALLKKIVNNLILTLTFSRMSGFTINNIYDIVSEKTWHITMNNGHPE